MKRLRNIFCIALLLFASLCVFGCGKTPPPNDDNSDTFLNLKNIVEEIYDVSSWQGIDIQTFNGNSEVIGLFKSNKGLARSSNNVDFIHIKGNHKIYCDDGVRYYIEDARKYLDESEFDYSEYESNLLSECLTEVEEFFKDDKNAENLLNSSKLDKADNIEYTFEILLDASTNRKLVATYICDKNNKLIMIKVSISDNSGKIDTEIKENTEIIVTPEWFHSDEFKTTITLEEMREVVFADDLFDGWTSAHVKDEIVCPLGWSGDDYKYNEYYLSKENTSGGVVSRIIGYNDTDKCYIVNGKEYIYKNNMADNLIVHDRGYDFNSKLNSLFYSFFTFSFDDGETMERYYTHSKKYEKDRTIYAFRLFDDASSNPNIERDEEAYGALYFDVDGNFYKAEYRMVAEITGYEEKVTTITKTDTPVEEPEWFNEDTFNEMFASDAEVREVVAKANVLNIEGFDYSATISVENNPILSDGVHFRQTAQVNNIRNGNDYYRNSVYELTITDEAQSKIRGNDEENNTEYGNVVSRDNAYTFWRSQKKLDNTRIYSYNRVEYDYINGVANKRFELSSQDRGFAPGFIYDVAHYGIMPLFYQGSLVSFSLPGDFYLPSDKAIVETGKPIEYDKCRKENTSNGTKYTIYYDVPSINSFMGGGHYFIYTINLDHDGNFVSSQITSDFLVQIENSVSTITFTRRTAPIEVPSWFNEEDFATSPAFDELQSVVKNADLSSWQGMDIQTFNGNSEVIGSFKSNKGLARSSNNVDFIHIKGNHKIYCDDGVRYYIEDARKYLDESEFDYSEYESNLLSECLTEVEEFFKDNKNAENLLNSSKLDKSDNIEYTFEILLDASTNKKLVATYICDKNNKLIMIKVSISDNSSKIDTEIQENTEIVITPEWFDLDDYKTDLTYEQVKAIFGDEHLLDGWDSAEWFLPEGYSDRYSEDKLYVSSKSKGITSIVGDSTKEFFDGEYLYTYVNGEPISKETTSDEEYSFGYKCQEFKTFAYNYFFNFESVYRDYYVASKKYEKDLTIISYKFFGDLNDVVFESICSLIYDVDGNLYEIRCYAKQESSEYASFELNLYMKKLDSVEVPEWFDYGDFNVTNLTFAQTREFLMNVNLFEGYNGVEFVETSNDTTRAIEFYGDGESICYYSRYDDGFDYGWGVSNDRVFYKNGIEYTYNEDTPVSSSSINTTYINFVENLQGEFGVEDMFVGVEDEENPLNNTNFKAIQYEENEIVHTNIEFCVESSQKIQKVIIHVYDVFIDMDFYEKTSSSDFDLYYSRSFKLLNVDNLPLDPEWFDYGDFPDELSRDEAEEYLESVDFGVNHWDGFYYDYVSQSDGSPARVYLDRDDTNGDRYIYESEWVTIKKSYGVNGKDYYYREGEPYSLTDRLKYSFRYDLLEYNENYTSNCGAYELYNTFIKELANYLDGISLWDEITTSNMVYTLTQYDEEKVFTMSYIIHLPDDLKNYYDDNSTINSEVILIVDVNNKFQKFSYKEFTESKVFTYMRLENYKEEISDPEWFNKSDFADVVIDLTLDEARAFASQDFYSSWTGVIVYNPEEFDGAYQLVYEKKSLTNSRPKYIYQYQNEGDYDDKEYCDGEFVYKYVNGVASSKRVYDELVDGLSKFDDELLFGLGVNGDGLVSDLTEENVIFLKKITHFNGEYEVQVKLRVLEDNYITFVFKFTSNGVCYEEDVIGEGKYNGEDVVATRIMRNLSCGYNLNPSTNGFVVLNKYIVEPDWFDESDFVDINFYREDGELLYTRYTTKNASISIEDPEKYGYTFLGWSYEQDGTTFVDLSKGFSDNVVNLYAVYSVNSYMIKYNILVEDESGSYYINNVAGCESVEIDFGTTFNLPNGKLNSELIPELKKDGYVFVGWSTSVGDAYYLLGSSYLLDTANDINFYACWVATEDDFCLAMDEKVFKYSYLELGEFYEMPNAILLDLNSEGIVACEISWEIICGDGLKYQLYDNGFRPLVVGEYSIKYTAVGAEGQILTTRTFTITVRDTIAPNIAIDGVIPSRVVFNPDSTGKMIIELPYVDAVDGNLNKVIEVEISIKDSNEQVLNVSYNEEVAYFTVDKPGTYVISFYAADDAENNITHVYTIQVVENL